MMDPIAALQMIKKSDIMVNMWQRYQKRNTYAASVTWDAAIGAVELLAEIVLS